MKNKPNLINFPLFVLILWLVFGCADGSLDKQPGTTRQRSPDPAPAAVSLHAAELVREFEDNEVRANQLYRGKTVRIHGTVNSVQTNKGGGVILTFKTSISTYSPAQCYFSKADSGQLARIKSNEETTVEGVVRGFSESRFSLVLDNCSIP
jgi:hypothetical protein